MVRYIDHSKMGRVQNDFLNTYYHFSFADYYNPNNMNFGILRVINDDIVSPHMGFDLHPHKDMEIISYIVEGEISHGDTMGNQKTVGRGGVQYMSAGTGVWHSEYNNTDTPLRLLQIWILPDKKGYTPEYGDYHYTMQQRENAWLLVVSGNKKSDDKAAVTIQADANLYATWLPQGGKQSFTVEKGRQAYLVLVEGNAEINGIKMVEKDALEIIEETIEITAEKNTHIVLIEMEKE